MKVGFGLIFIFMFFVVFSVRELVAGKMKTNKNMKKIGTILMHHFQSHPLHPGLTFSAAPP